MLRLINLIAFKLTLASAVLLHAPSSFGLQCKDILGFNLQAETIRQLGEALTYLRKHKVNHSLKGEVITIIPKGTSELNLWAKKLHGLGVTLIFNPKELISNQNAEASVTHTVEDLIPNDIAINISLDAIKNGRTGEAEAHELAHARQLLKLKSPLAPKRLIHLNVTTEASQFFSLDEVYAYLVSILNTPVDSKARLEKFNILISQINRHSVEIHDRLHDAQLALRKKLGSHNKPNVSFTAHIEKNGTQFFISVLNYQLDQNTIYIPLTSPMPLKTNKLSIKEQRAIHKAALKQMSSILDALEDITELSQYRASSEEGIQMWIELYKEALKPLLRTE